MIWDCFWLFSVGPRSDNSLPMPPIKSLRNLNRNLVETWMNWPLLTRKLSITLMQMLENMQNTQNMQNVQNVGIMQNRQNIWNMQNTGICRKCKTFYILAKAVNARVCFYSKPTKGKRPGRSCARTDEYIQLFILHSPTGAKKSLLLAPGLS